MADRQIVRFIDVVIQKDSPLLSAAGFGTLIVLTDYQYLSTTRRVREFSTVDAVEDFFGTSSEEALAADAYFNQDPFLSNKPENLYFGRYTATATAALLEGGDSPETDLTVWQAVTDGEFAITIDATLDEVTGLDFSSAASLSDVATVITAGLTQGTCIYRDGRFLFVSPTTGATSTITLLSTVAAPAGTDISGSDYLAGDTAYSVTTPSGAYLSQGQAAETVAEALEAIEDVNQSWYAISMLKEFRDTTDVNELADEIEARRKMFLITTNDANVLVLGNTSTNSYYVKNANYKRTGFIYHDNEDRYPEMSWMGQMLTRTIGQVNWAYKTLAGIAEGAAFNIDPVDLTETQKDAALDVNCNLYCATLSADFTFFGTMGGGRNVDGDGEYIDIVRNIDFLQARIEEGLLSLLLERDILPYTDAGITIAENRLKARLQQYGVDQGILVAGTVETSFPKRSETSVADRGDRLLPDGKFQAELVGGINKIVVRGTVYI